MKRTTKKETKEKRSSLALVRDAEVVGAFLGGLLGGLARALATPAPEEKAKTEAKHCFFPARGCLDASVTGVGEKAWQRFVDDTGRKCKCECVGCFNARQSARLNPDLRKLDF